MKGKAFKCELKIVWISDLTVSRKEWYMVNSRLGQKVDI